MPDTPNPTPMKPLEKHLQNATAAGFNDLSIDENVTEGPEIEAPFHEQIDRQSCYLEIGELRKKLRAWIKVAEEVDGYEQCSDLSDMEDVHE